MIYDKEFLKQLDSFKEKIIYAKITSLRFDEQPIETIEGRVTQGSINIDGSSAVRRTCSLSMVAEDININEYYWGLKTKFKLEIGLQNLINKNYPDIIWFPQGIYVITSFSTSLSTQGFNINIQGKDKMCLLNGEIGGTLNSSIDFGSIEEVDNNGNIRIIKHPIKNIIRESIHQYGGEFFHNIIINDLDDIGLELLNYNYDKPLYIFREEMDDTYFNGTFNGDMPCWINGSQTTISQLNNYDPLISTLIDLVDSDVFTLENKNNATRYCAAKITFGQTAGYRTTDLVYAGDLIASAGDSLTSILDKIKNMLGDYEYFYNLSGQFVFQKKKTFINTVYSPLVKNEDEASYVEGLAYSSPITYNFNGSELISTFNNSPDLNNLRNDFSVWGTRTSATGAEVPVHMRLAIDEKPICYTSIQVSEEELQYYNTKYNINIKPQNSQRYSIEEYDWRELIYQMAKDYNKFNHLDNFELKIIEANKNDELYQSGRTNYEQYYIDILGFWRQLYNPDIVINGANIKSGILAIDDLADFYLGEPSEDILDFESNPDNYYGVDMEHMYWAKNVYEAPEQLNFWIDFIESFDINQFSNKMIGNRPKALNDSAVTAIYFKDTPAIIFASPEEFDNMTRKDGFRYFITSNMDTMFSISTQGKSAKDSIDELLYNHSYCTESISINSIPIYYLEPNTKISVFDNKTNINGNYIVNKISIPLGHNGTMSITATKAVERLI